MAPLSRVNGKSWRWRCCGSGLSFRSNLFVHVKASYEDWSARSHLWVTFASVRAWYLHLLAPYCSIVSKMTFFKRMKNVESGSQQSLWWFREWNLQIYLSFQIIIIMFLFLFFNQSTRMDVPLGIQDNFVPSSSPNLFHVSSWMSSCLIWTAA